MPATAVHALPPLRTCSSVAPALQGCFDWWGYSGPGYASRVGTQTLVIKRELDVLVGKAPTPNATLLPPHAAAANLEEE